MKERCFGPIRFIPGENNGKYPFCHSLYLEEKGILIDPASDRNRLKRLHRENAIREVWLSHWHEDHFMHLDLFEDIPFLISRQDAPQLADVELFLDGYGIDSKEHRQVWREIVTTQFHFQPRKPAAFLQGGQQIRLKELTIDIIHTPGHTPGHMCFFFQEPGVLFMGDYDLTPFGPWYGDKSSSIPETISSIKRLQEIPADIWLTCHETGIFEEDPGKLWDQYLAVIDYRESRLLDYLNKPRTMADIVDAWIVYQRPREPKEFYALAEEMIMQKHLDLLISSSQVAKEGDAYVRRK
ncbi:MAG: MBL fold metallo-hydrolase [Desulfobacterales bacterium]|jgi:glyoxylase-like metal-dependent hydrolase (beta-lactamase superfamily II)